LQELVHNFKSGNGNFSDSRLSEVAKEILNNMNNDIADKLRADFKKTGHKERAMLHHYLLNQFCQYSQKEVDDGYPQ
jgi:flagellar motor switch protein FliM